MSGKVAPNIVRDGLVLYLDAANPRSYISGSTSWNDLTINSNNGNLINGPTFNNDNGGSVVFDGITGFTSINNGNIGYSPGTTGELSLEIWVYPTGPFTPYFLEPPLNRLGGLFGQGYFNLSIGWGLGVAGVGGSNYFTFQVRNLGTFAQIGNSPVQVSLLGPPFTNNQWYHVVGTFTRNNFIRLYVNGVLTGTPASTATLGNLSLTPNIFDAAIGKIRPDNDPVQFFSGCRISIARLYNKVLTPTEILQNYNATKNRYGL